MRACPFCGSRDVKVAGAENAFWTVCQKCAAEGPAKESRALAREAWNERKGEQKKW